MNIRLRLIIWSFSVFVLSSSTGHAGEPEFRILHPGDKFTVMHDDRLFTELDITNYKKPILYPVMGPGETPMTRNHPMKKDVEGEAEDHPHHKSIWCAHGDINGVSFWSEAGVIQVDQSKPLDVRVADDGSHASISYHANYIAPGGETVCTDSTTLSFRQVETGLAIDWDTTIHASQGALKFGDTKEGMMAIRTHPSLRIENDERKGVTTANGIAVNSQGGVGTGIWGRHAAWVDYSGKVEGKHVGVAIFDHPENLRHPTTWHARAYGLVAANPFGLSHFEHRPKGSGDFEIPEGGALRFRYRCVFHKGNAQDGKVVELYRAFAEP